MFYTIPFLCWSLHFPAIPKHLWCIQFRFGANLRWTIPHRFESRPCCSVSRLRKWPHFLGGSFVRFSLSSPVHANPRLIEANLLRFGFNPRFADSVPLLAVPFLCKSCRIYANPFLVVSPQLISARCSTSPLVSIPIRFHAVHHISVATPINAIL